MNTDKTKPERATVAIYTDDNEHLIREAAAHLTKKPRLIHAMIKAWDKLTFMQQKEFLEKKKRKSA